MKCVYRVYIEKKCLIVIRILQYVWDWDRFFFQYIFLPPIFNYTYFLEETYFRWLFGLNNLPIFLNYFTLTFSKNKCTNFRRKKTSHRKQFKQKVKNIKMFSTFCFSSDFTSNIFILESWRNSFTILCEILTKMKKMMHFKKNSTKKSINIPV